MQDYMRSILVILSSCSFLVSNGVGQPLAFPGAEGFGRHARGGRGGDVLFVTNLNDKGPGSLRHAIATPGARTVIFRISGTIALESELCIIHPFITIAGQTAPGDGICLKNYPLLISANDVIVRYLRVRLGDHAGKPLDGISVANAENVIIDHCSTSWTLDEAVNTWHQTKNITIQWCLVAESLHNSSVRPGHGYAASLGGVNTSYHHNLFANNAGRNPSIAGNLENPTINLDFRNNVIYNWEHRTLDGRPTSINIINNYYKPGHASKPGIKIVKIQGLHNGRVGRWYIQGNVMEGQSQEPDNWLDQVDTSECPAESARGDSPFECAPVHTMTAREAYQEVLSKAGAILPRRDATDKRILAQIINGKPVSGNGIISSQDDVGGWVTLKSGPPAVDTDLDGIPDDWEAKYGWIAGKPVHSHEDIDGDGYTQLEEYLNGTDPTRPETSKTERAF